MLTTTFSIFLLFWSVHGTSVAWTSILGEGSLLCGSSRGLVHHFSPVKGFFFSHYGNFFLTCIEGPRTEDVVRCTLCEAHWGNVIVILGYKIKWIKYLIWVFFLILSGFDLKSCKSFTQRNSSNCYRKYIFLVISGVICVSVWVCDSDRQGSWWTQWALGWVFCQSWHGEVTSPVTMFN